jgi:hypothetical protein
MAEMQENIQHGSIWLEAAAQLPHPTADAEKVMNFSCS